MPLYTDALGPWTRNPPENLIVQPPRHTSGPWQWLPEQNIWAELFRFSHEYNQQEWDDAGIWSYCLLQSLYIVPDGGLRSATQRIYPSVDAELRVIPFPKHLIDVGLIIREIGLKRIVRWRRRAIPIGLETAPAWRITVDWHNRLDATIPTPTPTPSP